MSLWLTTDDLMPDDLNPEDMSFDELVESNQLFGIGNVGNVGYLAQDESSVPLPNFDAINALYPNPVPASTPTYTTPAPAAPATAAPAAQTWYDLTSIFPSVPGAYIPPIDVSASSFKYTPGAQSSIKLSPMTPTPAASTGSVWDNVLKTLGVTAAVAGSVAPAFMSKKTAATPKPIISVPKSDNTLLYVILAAVGVVVLGGMFYARKPRSVKAVAANRQRRNRLGMFA